MVGTNGVLIDQGQQAVRVGVSSIQVITGGSERMRIDSSGNVGIGTNSPSAQLDVWGSIYARGGYQQLGAFMKSYVYPGVVGGASLGAVNTAGVEMPALYITDSSYVGIGTTNPSTRLQVNGQIKSNYLTVYGTGTTLLDKGVGYVESIASFGPMNSSICAGLEVYLRKDRSGTDWPTTGVYLGYKVDASYFSYLRFSNSGVSTNNLSVNGQLNVNGDGDGSGGGHFWIRNASVSSLSFSMMSMYNGSSDIGFNIFRNSSTRTDDGGVNTATLRNDGGSVRLMSNAGSGIIVQKDTGYVGIGTDSPLSPLHFEGSSYSYIRLGLGSSGVLNCGIEFHDKWVNYMSKGDTSNILRWHVPGVGDKMTLEQTGDFTVSGIVRGANIGINSDRRIKKDIRITGYSIESILRLEPVEYFYKDQNKSERKQIGFIAQQVKEVVPEVIHESRDYVPDIFRMEHVISRQDGSLLLSLSSPVNLVVGDKVKILIGRKEVKDLEVLHITLSSCLLKIDEKEEIPDDVFLYGKEVDDFHCISYDKLTVLLVKGAQEQQQMINDQQQIISSLTDRLSRMETILSRVIA